MSTRRHPTRRGRARSRRLAVMLVAVAALLLPMAVPPAMAAEGDGNVITVDAEYETELVFADGVLSEEWVDEPDDGCRLEQAIEAANTNQSVGACAGGDPRGGTDVIVLAVDTPVFHALPAITSAVDLRGAGHVIDGTDHVRLLTITGDDAEVGISNVELANAAFRGADGQGPGAAGGDAIGGALRVLDGAVVTADRVVFRDNWVMGGQGEDGAPGRLGVFTGGWGGAGGSGGDASGAAIHVDRAVLSLSRSLITGSSAWGGSGGEGGVGGDGGAGADGECRTSWIFGGGYTEEPSAGSPGGQGGAGGRGGSADGAAVSAIGGRLVLDQVAIVDSHAYGGFAAIGGPGGVGGKGGHNTCTVYIQVPAGVIPTDDDAPGLELPGMKGMTSGISTVPVDDIKTADDGSAGPQGVRGFAGRATSAVSAQVSGLTMTATTITGNSASTDYGARGAADEAVRGATTVRTAGEATLDGVTISGNSAAVKGGQELVPPGLVAEPVSGSDQVAVVTNTIMGGNSLLSDGSVATPECGTPADSGGHNALGDGACVAGGSGDVTFDAADLADATTVSPGYALPGGAASTVRVPSGALLGAAADCGDPDQLGMPRPAPCDIGAHEVGAQATAGTAPTTTGVPELSGAGEQSFVIGHYFDDRETPDELTFSMVFNTNEAVDDFSFGTDEGGTATLLVTFRDVVHGAGIAAITATDPDGMSVSTLVVFTTAYAGEPVLADDSYQASTGSTLTTQRTGLYVNDLAPGDGYQVWDPATDEAPDDLDFDAETGNFTYTPAEAGTFTYRYGNPDGEQATITFEVLDRPVAVDDTYVIPASDLATTIEADEGVLANDAVTGAVTMYEPGMAPPGFYTVDIESDGSLSVWANALGTHTFTYWFESGGRASKVATVTVIVTAPEASDDAYMVNQDSTLTVPAELGLKVNDENGDTTEIFVDERPTHGEVTIQPQDFDQATLSFIPGGGGFTYTPEPGFVGTDSFSYWYACPRGCSDIVATVTITVLPVNHAPTAADLSFTTAEDTTLTVSDPDDGLLGAASDVDGDDLTFTVDAAPSLGELTLNDDGTFEFIPYDQRSGTDSVPVTISDGTVSVTVTIEFVVTVVNDAPEGRADNHSTLVDEPLTVSAGDGVLGNDRDIDSTDLTVRLDTKPGLGIVELADDGSFEYLPDPGAVGVDTFTYRVVDDQGAESEPVTVTVVIAPEGVTVSGDEDQYRTQGQLDIDVDSGVLGNDPGSDWVGDLQAMVVDGPDHGSLTLQADGSFVYEPEAGYSGTDSFTYRAVGQIEGNDEYAVVSEPITVTIDVTETPDGSDSDGADSDRDDPGAGDPDAGDSGTDGDHGDLASTGANRTDALAVLAGLLLISTGVMFLAVRRRRFSRSLPRRPG